MAREGKRAWVLELADDLSRNPLRSALDDDWVLYHGTSGSYSASIETRGLGHPDGTPVYWDDVQSFTSYWRALGPQSPAFAALRAFSQVRDGIRAISLAETFERAARYAVEEPGGETIRLMSSSIHEIAEEVGDPASFRDRLEKKRAHLHGVIAQAGFRSEEEWDAANGATGSSFGAIDYALSLLEDPSALVSELDRFSSYMTDGEHIPVVYAVRIRAADISHLETDAAGINYHGVFSPERLLARVRIVDERVTRHHGIDGESADPGLEAWTLWRERLGRRH